MTLNYICPFCDSASVQLSLEFDEMCLGDETTLCKCTECEREWYDDTLKTKEK